MAAAPEGVAKLGFPLARRRATSNDLDTGIGMLAALRERRTRRVTLVLGQQDPPDEHRIAGWQGLLRQQRLREGYQSHRDREYLSVEDAHA
jgi:hypothetical protein